MASPLTYSSALGAGECLAGTFHLNITTNTFVWSEALFRLHGFSPGEVVPSVELLLAHKHPDDRDPAAEIIRQISREGGYFCLYHRIIDSRSRVRRVLTCGEGILDAAGRVTALDGVMIDLTATVHQETEQAAREAIAGATASRTVIGQAQGILMGRLLIGSNEAMRILMNHSSRTNVKLARVAADLVHVADSPHSPGVLDSVVRAMQGSHIQRRNAPMA
ncbi:PAS and ANTAR domain-containing protein [Arthrobacter sp. ISL-69]|uniref:PAS and ANTAR domain-containing protein n=1 Tax=Arthrobacter sp. ISL-69 TaxID=2819113 RepID=UPI001BE67EFC|nr:PAS and ANTAR domain-containing protein [Arthrobacter sp. ISL-69]MBT2538860.1 ANTAR domain-containing protein [Arthrobacter sp. ISL-69]